MTARWIAASLAVLALAGCKKKDEPKPPPPVAEAPAPAAPAATPPAPPAAAPAPAETAPTTEYTVAPVTPPPAVTTPDAPASIVSTYKPAPRPAGQRPVVKVIKPKPVVKVVKTKAEIAAASRIVGKWIQQKNRKFVLNFTSDGRVRGSDDPKFIWVGHWEAQPDGSVKFDLALEGSSASKDPDASLKVTAYPTPANIMAVVPHWGKELQGAGQFAYERVK